MKGMLARDEPVEFWDGTTLRLVKVTGTEILPLPPEGAGSGT